MEILAIAVVSFFVGWAVYAIGFFLWWRFWQKPNWKGGNKEELELQEKSLLL